MADSPSLFGLAKLAQDRVDDAKALLNAGRPYGAVYLSGYAVELALKARICKHLGWQKLDEKIFKSHELKFLLRFTGLESGQESFLTEWNLVSAWNPDMRYDAIQEVRSEEAMNIVAATEKLMGIFL